MAAISTLMRMKHALLRFRLGRDSFGPWAGLPCSGQVQTDRGEASRVKSSQVRSSPWEVGHLIVCAIAALVPLMSGTAGDACEACEGWRVTGTGHLVEATWAKYLGMRVLGSSIFCPRYVPQSRGTWVSWGHPWAWDQNNLGRHMGLSRRPSARSPARSCPALPRYYPYPIRSFIHPAIHPYMHPHPSP